MTEERPAHKGIYLLQSMLSRLKSSENLQDPTHVTAQHCRHLNATNRCDDVHTAELEKHHSECSVKPDLEYFTQRTVVHRVNPASTSFPQSDLPSSILHNVIRNSRHNLQPSESDLLLEEAKDKQASQAVSDFSILKNGPPQEIFTHQPSGSANSDTEPGLVKEITVTRKYDIMEQPCRRENTVTSVEQAVPPPLPPKQRNFNQMHGQLQRTFTLKDFKLDFEPINLLEEVCRGEEWAKFLPVKDPSPQLDAKDDSQRKHSYNSSDNIAPYNAVMKLNLSAGKEQSEITPSLVSGTDSQVEHVIQTRQETFPEESTISDLPSIPRKHLAVAQDIPVHEQCSEEENDLMVIYTCDKTGLTKDLPLDLSVVKSFGILDNSAQKSRIQLNNKRKHRPPRKGKRGNIKLLQCSASMASSQSPASSPVSVSFSSSTFYILPESGDSQTKEDSHTSVLANEMMKSEVSECYSNDNGIARIPEANLTDMYHDFSFVKSSGLLDNSALKNRINLSKKRKHRPPGKTKHENTKKEFPIKFFQWNASDSRQAGPASHTFVPSSSAFYNIPGSYNSNDSKSTPVPVKEKQKTKDRFLKPKLWKTKS